MSVIDSRQVVWESICSLMQEHWGAENMNRLAREAKLGLATVARLKGQNTSVGIEVLDKIAQVFDVHTWQLLVPGMNASSLPTLMPLSDKERQLYERLANVARDFTSPEKPAQ